MKEVFGDDCYRKKSSEIVAAVVVLMGRKLDVTHSESLFVLRKKCRLAGFDIDIFGKWSNLLQNEAILIHFVIT